MKIDMHVHTSRYSPCAAMSPEAMAEAALDKGLKGVVITEHDYLWPAGEIEELQEKFPRLKIFRGAEISAEQGHVLVYGVPSIDKLYKKIPMGELVEQVHRLNGIAVVAHPCRYSDEIPGEIFTSGLDGFEAMSMNVLEYMRHVLQLIQNRLGIPGIAGSDAHDTESLGVFATDFDKKIENEPEMVAALKNRSFSLYRKEEYICGMNLGITGRVNEARALIDKALSQGRSNAEIKAMYGFSYSFQYGVRNNKDMRLLYRHL